ncbi:FG-GAP repeat-containing protein [Filimonas lacunae]|uniref:FG-GAP repeat-containing protein n=1 Tax=Filimonas lacunae TaxID=477680 RepID=A0A1N7RFE6_9BACT|nr:FG-GAP-like repeat-containing protein [Filimonas lacunae]SIT33704.1 FG-GAP repeat-containing protein [Filimonas lacunae]
MKKITNSFQKALCFLLALQLQGTVQAQHTAAANNEEEFSIVVLPDTQYYTAEKNGGKKEMFYAQTDWIVKNAAKERIQYVIQLGDISDDGEKIPQEWVNASEAMYRLEKPLPGYPQGIPYGLAVGNHDQTKSQFPVTGKTDQYNKYFGVAHFKGKQWYGGHYGNDNDSHYDLLTVAGMKLLVLYFEYDSYDENIEGLNRWAAGVLEKYSDRKAILVSHSIIHFNKTAGTNEKGFPPFSKQGKRVFDRLKSYPNVMITLCGHVGDNGEGYRQDGYAGNVIKTFLSDYQSRPQGGHGLMRLMSFSPSKDLIRVRTFSPFTGEEETDADSQFTLPWLHHTTVSRFLDYNNDQVTDVSFFANGDWKIAGQPQQHFGEPGDIAAPADYDGDGKTDLAVFRPSAGKFYLQSGKVVTLGNPGDIPVCGDWDGDGFADVAVYRPATLTWYIDGMDSIRFGHKNSVPVPADYDGDGILDVGVFRTDNSLWQTSLGNIPLEVKHTPGDIPVPGDYDGDGRAEMAVYRPATNEWLINFKAPVKFGQAGDIPVPGNYHKGGKTLPAVYRQGKIYVQDGMVIEAGEGNVQELLNVLPGVRMLGKVTQ